LVAITHSEVGVLRCVSSGSQHWAITDRLALARLPRQC